MARSRFRIVDPECPHFFTCTIVDWLPVFSRPEAAEIVLDSWRFLQEHNRIEIQGYVIMENHLHFVASSPDLTKEIGDFKSHTAREIIERLKRTNKQPLLDRLRELKAPHKKDRTYQGSRPKMIVDETMMRQKLDYIHANPVRRGYVDRPTDWRYSSARDYDGREGLIPVTTDWG